jgi:uncharacterized SAM-binding protein YcdF (DUF218 family)
MFFALSKIFNLLFMPLTWIILLFLISFFPDKSALKATFRLSGLFLLLVFSNSYLTYEAIRRWELPVKAISTIEKPYDVGIVLGGGMVQLDTSNGEYIFRGNNDRFLQAVKLYKAGKIKKILISGGSGGYFNQGESESKYIKFFLVKNGIVPEQDIWIDTLSKNTHENAVESKKVLFENGAHGPFLLITSATHMRRSLGCFKKVGLEVVPFVTDKLYISKRRDFQFLLVPAIENMMLWDGLFHEWIGFLSYKVAGYL